MIVVPWEENMEIFRHRPFFLSRNFLKLQLNCFSYWIWVQNTYAGINSRDVHNTSFSFIFYGIYLMMWGRESSIVSIGSIFNILGTIYWVCLICFLTSHSLTVYLVRHHLTRFLCSLSHHFMLNNHFSLFKEYSNIVSFFSLVIF